MHSLSKRQKNKTQVKQSSPRSVNLKSSLRKFWSRHHDLVDRYGTSVSQMTTHMVRLWWSQFPGLSSFMIYHVFVTRVTLWIPPVEQELLILPEHMGSSLVVSVDRVARICIFCVHVLFCISLFVFLTIVLSVLLWLTTCDYPFSIFTHSLIHVFCFFGQ